MNIAFMIFIGIIAMEYMGIDRHYVPALKALPVLALASLGLFVFVVVKYRFRDILEHKQTKLLIFFIFLTGLGTLHGLISSYALQFFIQQVGYFLLFVTAYYVIDDYRKIKLFMVAMVVFHAIMAIVNQHLYFAEVREGIFKAGYFLGDGNDFAWSMAITSGFAIYLFIVEKSIVWKMLYGLLLLAIIYAILGTQSRGAALALGSAVFYYWLMVSKKKLLGFIVIAAAVTTALIYVPDHYTERLETISEYEQDGSAMGRIKAWGTAIEMAVDHPILGVGAGSFNSAYGRLYRKASDPVRWISTHSIYFKTLAEYGFIGVTIYVMMIYGSWKGNRRIALSLNRSLSKARVPVLLPEAINMSLIGFAVGGLFLGGINYPHLFLLIALTMRLQRLVKPEIDSDNKVVDIFDDGTDYNNVATDEYLDKTPQKGRLSH